MSHRGGNGFDSGESPHGTLLYAGSIPALSTLAAASRQTSLEAGADAIPPRLRGSDGAIIQLWRCSMLLVIFSAIMGAVMFYCVAKGQGWL